MQVYSVKTKRGIGLAMCLMLFLFVSLAVAVADDKKDKDKDKPSKGSSHESHKVSNSGAGGRAQSNGGGNGAAQSAGQSSGSSQNNSGTSNTRFSRDSNPRNNRVSEQTTSQDKHYDAGNGSNGTSNSRFSRDSNPRNNHVSEQTPAQDKHSDAGYKNDGYGNAGNNGKGGDSGNNARRFDRGDRYDRNSKGNVSDNRHDDFSRRDRVNEHDRTVVRDTRSTEVRTFRAPVRTERNFGDRRVAFDNRGRVRDIHSRDIVIHRGLRGERTFVTERRGVRIVSVGGHYGYTQRTYISRGPRVYVQRTYVLGGVTYARAYRSYYWHGAVFYSYAPAYYYRPAFYVWTFNPWPRPIYYRWGWASDPWYPAYGYYFQPYAYYPTASAWLVDYLIAENLRLSYEARRNAELAAAAQQQQYDQGTPQDYPQNAPPQDGNTVQLSPEVKQMIADEVQRQLAAERAASEQGANIQQAAPVQNGDPGVQGEEVPAALDPNHRVFVVASNLDVVAEDGQECTLTPGDVILRTSNTPDGTKVAVNVISSKRGDCASNTNAALEVNDLQEMHNHFREQLDSGMKALVQNQGKDGLPAAPDTGTVNGEVPPPTADANAQNELQDEQNAADGVEGAVKAAEKSPGR